MNVLRSIWEFIEILVLFIGLFMLAMVAAVFLLVLAALLSPLWLVLMIFILFAGPARLARALQDIKRDTDDGTDKEDTL